MKTKFKNYIKGIYPEWVDCGERIAFAVEFDKKMLQDKGFFPKGIEEISGGWKYKEAIFEDGFPAYPWFWLDPEKDITSYTDKIGEVFLEDSLQLRMAAPSPVWKELVEWLKPQLIFHLFLTTNVDFGHSIEEWESRYSNREDLWDFCKEDLIGGAVEPNGEIVYWEIDGRLYETDISVKSIRLNNW